MRLIVGLGNPGRTYKYSRHNIGSLLLDRLAKRWRIKIRRDLTIQSCLAKGRIQGREIILARPLCFMNRAGYSVDLLLKKYNLNSQEDMLVIFDDLDLAVGKIRIRPKGSSGGHRGVESIIKVLGSSDFARLRIGIGRPQMKKSLLDPRNKQKVIDYVLGTWTLKEKEQLDVNLEQAAECCETWVVWGINRTMNKFN